MGADDPANTPDSLGPPPLFVPTVSTDPAQLCDLRHALGDWATLAGLPEDDVEYLVLATYEQLMLDVWRPTRPDGEAGAKTLRVDSTGEEVVVAITDHAPWQSPPTDNKSQRNRLVIYRLAPRSECRHTATGTTTYLRWPLPAKRGT